MYICSSQGEGQGKGQGQGKCILYRIKVRFCLKPFDFEVQLRYRSIRIVLLISCCLGKGIRECQGARSRYVRGMGQGCVCCTHVMLRFRVIVPYTVVHPS